MTQSPIRFGEFVVDVAARELRHLGVPVSLQEQPFQLLLILLERPGEVVHRELIRQRLWPDGTFVDFEHSVNAAIRRLRIALGDSADDPRFVVTVPRRGYRFIAPLDADVAGPCGPSVRPRLVVLPFTSIPAVSDDYFSEGLTEELIAQLGRRCSHHIGVLARKSSLLYKRLLLEDETRSRESRLADYHVEGSVRRDGARVRITARLVSAADDTQVWARSYDRQAEDCLAVQAELANEISQALALELLPPSTAGPIQYSTPTGAVATSHPGAYQAFLRGRYHWNKAAEAGLEQAIAGYDEAVALDPRCARAYSSRARARVALCECYRARPTVALHAALDDANRALALDPGDAEALLVRGEVSRVLLWDWNAAEDAFRAALASNASSDAAHRYYALFLATQCRPEADAVALRACDLDPLCLTVNSSAALVAYYQADYERAAQRYRQVLDMDPQFAPARRGMAATLVQLGRPFDAVAQLRGTPVPELDPVSRIWLGYALALSGETDEARTIAEFSGSQNSDRCAASFHLAFLYASLGQFDDAIACLEQACENRDPAVGALLVEPAFGALREEARFQRVVDRVGLRADRRQLR